MKEIEDKIVALNKYEEAYYKGIPLISDSSYDLLKDSVLRTLPKSHPYRSKVGHKYDSPWAKDKHSIFMGSLNKVSTEEEINEWVAKIYRIVGTKQIEFVIQPKIDGLSIESKYDNGELFAGLTRGDGFIGEVITPNVIRFKGVPCSVGIKKNIVVRGEGVILKRDFDLLQKKRKGYYSNARNAAAGISRTLDGAFSEQVSFIAYDVNANVDKESAKIEVLNKLGFQSVDTITCNSLKEIINTYVLYKEKIRDKLSYAIDGLVLKINDLNLQEKLGIKNNRPEYAVALKFESDQAITTNKKIKVQVGRTGKLTPLALLNPVNIMGSTVSKATLHNFAYIENLMIGIGSEVTIEKKGDIIPQVVEVLTAGKAYEKPSKCPSCGGHLVDDDVNLWCFNEGCREREVNRIIYWVKTLDIKGFSGKFIERLWDMDKIRCVSDIYRLTPDDFTGIDGIGEKTIKSFFKALEKTKAMYLDTFITALGIPGCSTSTSKVLVETFKDWEGIKKMEASQIEALPGFAEKSASQIIEGLGAILDMAEELLGVIEIKEKKEGALTGSSFCVTGSLANYSRKEFKEVVEENGGVFKSSVAAGLTYLVTNDPNSGSAKNRKAEKLGVKLIDEQGFLDMLGKKPEPKEEKKEKKDDVGVILEYESLF